MRNDEVATYLFYVRKPPLYGLVSYTLPNNHVLHTLLVSVSTWVFGNHPWAIRLPAFVAGVALIPLTYVVARRLFDERAGLVAAAFVASSSVLIELSTNARGYTMAAAAFLGLLALGLGLPESGRWRAFVWVAALGFFTVPTMLFPFGAVVVWMACRFRHERPALTRLARAVLHTAVLTVLLYLPALLWTGPHAFLSNRFVTSQPFGTFARAIGPSLGSTWSGWNRDLGVLGAVLFAASFVVGLSRRRSSSLVAAAVLWCGVLVIAERWVPFHRVWSFLIPLYWIVVAAGIAIVVRRARWAPVIAVALCLAIGGSVLASGSVLRSRDTGYFPDAERIAVALRALGPHDRVLVYNPATVPLQYYATLHHETLPIGGRARYVVVDAAAGQTLGLLAQQFKIDARGAQVWRRFSQATVYRLPGNP